MATRKYSSEERDELLSRLREAFEGYYVNSDFKHLSLGKSKEELGSKFFRKLGSDSNKENIELEFTISRSTLEPFFKNDDKDVFSDTNSTKINALINFYSQHVFDPKTKETKLRKDLAKQESLDSISNDSKVTLNQITSIPNLKDSISWFGKYRTILSYLVSVLLIPLILLASMLLANESNIIFFSFALLFAWVISTVTTVKGFLITRKKAVKGKVSNVRNLIFSLGALMSILYLIYTYYGASYILNGNSINKGTYSDAFVEDPAGLGYGSTSINFNHAGANDTDELDLQFLVASDSINFYVFIDYQNATDDILYDPRVKIGFTKKGVSKSTNITGELISSKGTLIDQTKLINLPSTWTLEIVSAYCVNNHSELQCPDYAYEIRLDIDELIDSHGTAIPRLDTYGESSLNGYSGACSQGHVMVEFKLVKL